MSNATNREDCFDDEIVSWLQYPLEDTLEKSYCSDAPGQWSSSSSAPPFLGTTASHVGHVKHPPYEPSLFMRRSTSAEIASYAHTESLLHMRNSRSSMESLLHVRNSRSSMESVSLRYSNAEDALALGAQRAAGLLSQVGHEEFDRVRTSLQPRATSVQGCHHSLSSVASDGKDYPHVVKQQGLYGSEEHDRRERVKQFPTPRLSTSLGISKRCGHGEPSQACFLLSASMPTSGSSRSAPEGLSIRSKGPASSMQLTSASIPSSLTSSELKSKDWHNRVVVGKRQSNIMGPASCSTESLPTTKDLSCRDMTYGGKRKLDDLDQPSEMSEEDQSDDLVEMMLPRKSSSSKRNRIPEAHNLSERNRRNRINEKLKSLQELIPNSSKTDKASVLDEAIEYMKTLQMQLQMLSIRNNVGMPPVMMIPMGVPQSHMHVAPLQQVGIGIPVGHAGMPSMGVAGLGAGMVDIRLPMVGTFPRPFQSADVPGYGIPYQSRKVVGCTESYSQLGYGPSGSLSMTTQNFNESQNEMRDGSECQPYAHPCPGQEQEQKHGHSSLLDGNVQNAHKQDG